MQGNIERKRRRNRKSVSDSNFSFESSEEESVSSTLEEEEDDEESEWLNSSEDDGSDDDEAPSFGRGARKTPKKTVTTKRRVQPSIPLASSTELQGKSEAELNYFSFREASGARFTPTYNSLLQSTDYVSHNSLFSPLLPPRFVGISRVCCRQKRNQNVSSSSKIQEEAQYLKAIQSCFVPIIPHFKWDETLAEKRPVCIVTGTNSGIGFCTAVGLAAEGYEVIITCRSASLTADVAKQIKKAAQKLRASHAKKYSNAPDDVIVVGKMPIECDNFDSVRAFVSWFRENYEDRNLQVLVNNAGMMRKTLCFSAFNSQLELHTAVNFLGPLLLTELLLPFLERHGGRVVYVSSEAHRFPQTTLEKGLLSLWKRADPHSEDSLVGGKLLRALQDLNQGAEKCTGPFAHSGTKNSFSRYGTSKLLNTYHAHHIARRYSGAPKGKRVYACSLHPGCVSSGFQKDLIRNNLISTFFAVTSLLFLKTGEEGAQTSLHCAMCPVESLELITPTGASNCNGKAVSPYFAECTENTRSLLLGYGWDIDETEKIVAWGKKLVNL